MRPRLVSARTNRINPPVGFHRRSPQQIRISSVNDTSGFGWTGRLTLIADRNGNTQTLLYNANDRFHSVSDNFGRSLTFAYNTDGRLQTLTTPIGSFTYVYANSNLTKVIHPVMDEYTYSSAGNLLALTENKNGGTERTTTFTWSASGQMTGIDGLRTDAADTLAFIYYPNAAIIPMPLLRG